MTEISLRKLRAAAESFQQAKRDFYLGLPDVTLETAEAYEIALEEPETLLALVEAVEAVRAWENAQTDPDLAITEDRYRAALARFTDYPADGETT